jgi:hypothetical protein
LGNFLWFGNVERDQSKTIGGVCLRQLLQTFGIRVSSSRDDEVAFILEL